MNGHERMVPLAIKNACIEGNGSVGPVSDDASDPATAAGASRVEAGNGGAEHGAARAKRNPVEAAILPPQQAK